MNLSGIPVRRWTLLVLVAVVGSLVYGGSLALVLPSWTLRGAALWLTLSAGLAWCAFIPGLIWLTRLTIREAIDACLVTMAAGEVVLTSGAVANLLLARSGRLESATLINATIVAISNVVMLATLIRNVRDRVAGRRVFALWMMILNGSGALFFALLYRWCRLP